MDKERDLARRFGENARNARSARKWTQATLAERLDISLDYVGMLERGERLPSFDVAIRMANALGTTVVDLLGKPPGEAWEEEALALLRSMSPSSREMVLSMLRAAAAAPVAPTRSGRRRARTRAPSR